jgi:hypothetical protein
VSKCVLGGLTGLVEPLPRVLAQRLEQEEALVAERLQQAVVEERGELVEVCSRDRLGGLETERAAEDRETAEGSLSVGVEEVVAPFDRRAQRPLPLRQIDRAAPEQREHLSKALQQGGWREQLDPRRCQLDCEREVVHASTDRRDRLVDGNLTSTGCRAADEELGRSVVQQRLDGQHTLGAQVQRCARGGEHDDLAHEEIRDDGGDSLQMLEVVEHEQNPSRGEPAGDVVVGL